MSRSYKKTPGWTDQGQGKRRKYYKRLANKIVRKTKFSQNGGWYKKTNGLAYDICDHKFLYYSQQDVINSILRHIRKGFVAPEPLYRYYMK